MPSSPSSPTKYARAPGFVTPGINVGNRCRSGLLGTCEHIPDNSGQLAGEGGDAGLGAPQDQGVDVVGAFVSVDRLQVHHVADHVVLVGDAVAAMHVAGGAGDVERLAAIVA